MSWLRPKALVMAAAAIGLVGVGGWALFGVAGLVAAVLIAQLVAIGSVAAAWRHLHGDLATRLRALETAVREPREPPHAQEEHRAIRDELTTLAATVDEYQRATSRELEAAASDLVERDAATRDEVGKQLDRLGDDVADAHHRVEVAITQLYRQSEALAGLYVRLRPRDALPATRDWSASPDLLLHLTTLVREHRPATILECGSGISTLVFAYLLRDLGQGRVVSLEHLDEFAAATEALLAQHGVADQIEVRRAPLVEQPVNGETWPWYAAEAIPAGPFDLVLVDGPPGKGHPQARYPAGPLLLPRLAPGGLLVLDDYDRSDEREIVDRWLAAFPELTVTVVPHEKGTAVLRRGHGHLT